MTFGTWYPHTLDGLLLSYTAALPFFRNSLASNMFYGGLFFGSYVVVKDIATAWLLRKHLRMAGKQIG
mgnify:CR=1 FL=1